jgi:hypothetical protein
LPQRVWLYQAIIDGLDQVVLYPGVAADMTVPEIALGQSWDPVKVASVLGVFGTVASLAVDSFGHRILAAGAFELVQVAGLAGLDDRALGAQLRAVDGPVVQVARPAAPLVAPVVAEQQPSLALVAYLALAHRRVVRVLHLFFRRLFFVFTIGRAQSVLFITRHPPHHHRIALCSTHRAKHI